MSLNPDTASLCTASVLLGYGIFKLPSIRLFPDPTLVYLVLDVVQLCYLYGHSVRPVMIVVYMEHTSNHLGNSLAKEFLGHTHQRLRVKGRGQCLWPAAVCVMTFLPRLNRAEIIQSVTRVISNREILTSLLAGGLREPSLSIFSVSLLHCLNALYTFQIALFHCIVFICYKALHIS